MVRKATLLLLIPAVVCAWWNDHYSERAQISLGGHHERIDSIDTIELRLHTGYMSKIYRSAIPLNVHPWGDNITHGHGKTLVTYLSASPDMSTSRLRVFVSEFVDSTNTWKEPTDVADAYTVNDSHFYPSVCVDKDGYLQLFYGCHNSQMHYKKSTNPRDPTSWGTEQQLAGYAAYPKCFVRKNGDIYIWYRSKPGYRWYGYKKSTDGGSTWRGTHTVMREPEDTPYDWSYGVPWYDSTTDRIHFACFWREVSGDHKDIAYCYSDDGGATWKKVDGTSQAIPLTHANADIGYACEGDECASVADVCGSPNWDSECAIMFYRWPDSRNEATELSYCALYYDGSRWHSSTIATFAQPGQWNRGGMGCDSAGNLYAFMKKQAASSVSQLVYSKSTDGGQTWSDSRTIGSGDIAGDGNAFLSVADGTGDGVIRVVWAKPPFLFYFDSSNEWFRRDMLPTGDDVRIVRMLRDSTYRELHRVADVWNAKDSRIYFRPGAAIAANEERQDVDSATYWVYYGYPSAKDPPNNPDSCFPLFESFEDLNSCSPLHGQGRWVCEPETGEVWVNELHARCQEPQRITHPEEAYHGSKIAEIYPEDSVYCSRLISPDPSAHEVEVAVRAGATGYAYGGVASPSDRFLLGLCGNRIYYYNGSWNGSGKKCGVGRYHALRFRVTPEGVTAYCDGEVIVKDDNSVSECDRVCIGCEHTSPMHAFYDRIIARKYYSNPPAATAPEANRRVIQ